MRVSANGQGAAEPMVFIGGGLRGRVRRGLRWLLVVSVSGLVLAGCSGPAAGGRAAERQPVMSFRDFGERHELWTASPLAGMALRVTQEGEPGTFAAQDELTLRMFSAGGKEILVHPFESSYGDYRIELIDLTDDGAEEIVFVVGRGRGTSARSEYLIVTQLQGQGLGSEATLNESPREVVPLLEEPVRAYYGSGVEWWYKRTYADHDFDGLNELHLELDYDPVNQTPLESPELIPPFQAKWFEWDPVEGRMTVIREVPRTGPLRAFVPDPSISERS